MVKRSERYWPASRNVDRLAPRGASTRESGASQPARGAAAKAGDVVITPKLDRMFRSALDALDVLARLKDRGVSLHMIDLGGDVTGNGISKLVFTILSAVAEAERDRTRERAISRLTTGVEVEPGHRASMPQDVESCAILLPAQQR